MFHNTFFSYSTVITPQSRRDAMATSERILKDRAHPRLNMVNCQLRPNGVRDERLIQAFKSIPMESFVPPSTQSMVYSDSNLCLTPDLVIQRWLLAPLTLGKLLQLANIQPHDRVMIIGCGTGYSLALVAQLADQVIGVESDEDLAYTARNYAQEQGISNIKVVTGALSVGYPKEAPYDVIIIEGAVEHIPSILIDQLDKLNGRLVTVIKEHAGTGQLSRQSNFGKGAMITRLEDTLTQIEKFEASCPHLAEFEQRAKFYL